MLPAFHIWQREKSRQYEKGALLAIREVPQLQIPAQQRAMAPPPQAAAALTTLIPNFLKKRFQSPV